MICGIYTIINLFNKRYIGSSKDILKRCHHHFYQLKNNKHPNPKLQAAYNKYGLYGFGTEITELCEESELLNKEQFYIDNLKPEYNIVKVAGGGDTLSNHPNKDVMIEKRKKVLLNFNQSEEGRNLSKTRFLGKKNPRFGKKLSNEEKEKLTKSREHLKGTTRSDEVKRKVSESLRKYHVERKKKSIENKV